MAREEPPIDWDTMEDEGLEGRFMELLARLPRARWAERDEQGDTLLHYASMGSNVAAVVALLAHSGLDVNVVGQEQRTPAHVAAANAQPRVLEVLCAAGADLRARDEHDAAPVDRAVWCVVYSHEASAQVLVANGVRLSTVRDNFSICITPALVVFERGVLRCRAAVVAMLRVKQAGRLVRWDKFLLRHLALELWTTRYDPAWQRK